jgi:uncharacterized protein involved in response to NO
MVFGFAAATAAGCLLTAIPNWTGRMPLQGRPLATLVLLWAIGRVGVWLSARIGAPAAADLCFSAAFLAVVMREILTGQELAEPAGARWPSLLLVGNPLVHLDALGLADTSSSVIALGRSHC